MRIIVYPHQMTVGGSQLNAIELAAAVRDRGHDVSLFAAEGGPLEAEVKDLQLPLVIAPHHKRRPSMRIALTLRDLCRREHVDIVHGYEWPPCLEAFYGPLLFDRVTVGCTVMSMAVAPFIPSFIPLIVGTEQIAAAARASRSGRVCVIEPPVDTEKNHPNVQGDGFRTRYRLDDRPTLVLVSRLTFALKLEGIERAMAAAEILARDVGLRLVIVGDGPARVKLARAAAEINACTGDATVTFTGELADPRSAYAAADVVLGMGGSALRAMAFAKPVVILGEHAFAELVTPESVSTFLWQGFYGLGDNDKRPERLAQLLRSLLADTRRRAELGAFARQLAESRFSLASAGSRQVDVYREWLQANRPRRSELVIAAARTATQVLSHKARQRLDRWRGREVAEDFNAVWRIAKTAEVAETTRRR
jgi:glycosyltransferase involved in cell wall biosynthesis